MFKIRACPPSEAWPSTTVEARRLLWEVLWSLGNHTFGLQYLARMGSLQEALRGFQALQVEALRLDWDWTLSNRCNSNPNMDMNSGVLPRVRTWWFTGRDVSLTCSLTVWPGLCRSQWRPLLRCTHLCKPACSHPADICAKISQDFNAEMLTSRIDFMIWLASENSSAYGSCSCMTDWCTGYSF